MNALTNSRFCGQSEEDDPSEEFEEYLACAVCGDNGEFDFVLRIVKFTERRIAIRKYKWVFRNSRVRALTSVPAAHRQCARDAGSLASDEGTCRIHVSTFPNWLIQ